MDQIGERVRTVRQRIGYSQEALARRADVSNGTIIRIETGRNTPSLDTLRKIAVALDVTVSELLGHDEPIAS